MPMSMPRIKSTPNTAKTIIHHAKAVVKNMYDIRMKATHDIVDLFQRLCISIKGMAVGKTRRGIWRKITR